MAVDERDHSALQARIQAAGRRVQWLGGTLTIGCVVVFPILWLYLAVARPLLQGGVLETVIYGLFVLTATPAAGLFAGYFIPRMVMRIHRNLEEIRLWFMLKSLSPVRRAEVLLPVENTLRHHHPHLPSQERLLLKALRRTLNV